MKKIFVILGPTSSGKTSLAFDLCKKMGGEIISADSRQIYKYMDIGTGKLPINSKAKIQKQEQKWIIDDINVWGYDLITPDEHFSSYDFAVFALKKIRELIDTNKAVFLVGGTGFYIKSYLYGIDTLGIPADLNLRKRLEKLSVSRLYQRLSKIDPHHASRMNDSDSQNPRRLIRAIEIAASQRSRVNGQRAGSWKLKAGDYLLIGLTAPNEYLYQKADDWLETRLNRGLVEEVGKLIKQGISPDWLENLGLEYRWITRYIQVKISLEEAKKRLQGDIHEFIRRQKTFFNQFADIQLFDISKENWLKELEKTVSTWYNQQDGRI